MKKEFDDIFESINLMHKKYSSKEYLDNIDKFKNDSVELEQILEKYNTQNSERKTKKKSLLKNILNK